MPPSSARTQNIVTLASQIGSTLLEAQQLLEPLGSAHTDLQVLLIECRSLIKQLNFEIDVVEQCSNHSSPSYTELDSLDACNLALRDAHTVIYEMAVGLRNMKPRNSMQKIMHRDMLSEQKQRMKLCRFHLHAASRSLNCAMFQQSYLQALDRVDLASILQKYFHGQQSSSQDMIAPNDNHLATGHVYQETNISGDARVIQGNVYKTYNYFDNLSTHPNDNCYIIANNEPYIDPAQSRSGNERAQSPTLPASTSLSRTVGPNKTPMHNDQWRSSNSTISRVNSQAHWQLLLPFRWLGWVCHVQAMRAHGRWTFTFTTWSVLKQDAPIFDCIERDDLLGFRQLIDSGKYTIYDRDQRGQTLLTLAISEAAVNIMHFQLSRDKKTVAESICHSFIGSSGKFSVFVLISCIQYFLESYSNLRSSDRSNFYNTQISYHFNTLFDIIHNESLIEEESAWGMRLYTRRPLDQPLLTLAPSISHDVGHHISSKLFAEYPHIGIDFRLGWALYASNIRCFWEFWILLGKIDLDLTCVDAQVLKDQDDTILTHCADLFACSMRNETTWPPPPLDENYERLVKQALDLHDLERSFNRNKSPLLSLIFTCISGCNSRTLLARVKLVLWHWLDFLDRIDVNLEHYGKQEQDFFQMSGVHEFYYQKLTTGIKYRIRLMGFCSGKHAYQWQFWFSTSEDEIANTFLGSHWIATGRLPPNRPPVPEDTPQLMPGAWIDDIYKPVPDVSLTAYVERVARSRRRRKRYMTAAGYGMRDARKVFGNVVFHDYARYYPRKQKEDCSLYCSESSSCRLSR